MALASTKSGEIMVLDLS